MTRGFVRTSAGLPSAIFSPWSSTVTRSETPITTFMSCSISRIVSFSSSRSWRMNSVSRCGLLRVHAGGRLVEQQQLRVGRQRPRDLHPPLVAVGQLRGELVEDGLGAGRRRRAARGPARASARSSRRTRGGRRIDPNSPARIRAWWPTITFSTAVIAPNRRMFWNVRATPSAVITSGRARGDVAAAEVDPPLGRLVQPGQHVEEGRLAGAVRPDDRDDRVLRDVERDVRRRRPGRRTPW